MLTGVDSQRFDRRQASNTALEPSLTALYNSSPVNQHQQEELRRPDSQPAGLLPHPFMQTQAIA
jgi:hypothetical protein